MAEAAIRSPAFFWGCFQPKSSDTCRGLRLSDLDTGPRGAAGSGRRGDTLREQGSGSALDGEAHGQDEDLVPFLNGNVVAAGLHFRHFQDDFSVGLFHYGGLVVVLVVRKEDRGDRILAQIFAGQGDAIVHLARGRGDGSDFRRILSARTRRQAEQEYERDEADLEKHSLGKHASTGRAYGSVLHPGKGSESSGARIVGWTVSHGSTSKLPVNKLIFAATIRPQHQRVKYVARIEWTCARRSYGLRTFMTLEAA